MNANRKSTQRRKGAEFQTVPEDYRQWIEIGDLRLARLENGKLWMQHRAGEGMETNHGKLAKLLEGILDTNFAEQQPTT